MLVALETVLSNHIYQCKNSLNRQQTGGGIGARITGVIARILMDIWTDKISQILEDNNINVYLLAKYVDDVNIATSLAKEGSTWNKEGEKWRLVVTNNQKEKDLREGKSPQERTMSLI